MNFNFGEVLTRAWQIVWKRRVLWIFGILASCTRGGSGSNFNWNMNDGGSPNGGTSNLPPELMRLLQQIAENIIPILIGLFALICIIWIVAIFLGTIGKIGLIRGTWLAETGGELVFGQLFSESMRYFWRMFGLSLLVGLPFVLVVAAMVAATLAFGIGAASRGGDASVLGLLTLLPLFLACMCLLVPIGFVVNLIVRQSERAIVLEDAGVIPSLVRGWEVFRSNLGPVIVMAIILAVIGLVVGFVLAIPIIIVVVPATFAFIAGNAENWGPMMFALACICLLTPVLWLINGILVAYLESVWTLTYMRLVQPLDTPPAPLEANA